METYSLAGLPADPAPRIGFVGGGSMATALIGGLRRSGVPGSDLHVIEPVADARALLADAHGVRVYPSPDAALSDCDMVVWAIKPQQFEQAARRVAPLTARALHVSVAAGLATASLCNWLATGRVVRAMPNTPALIGKGMTGLYAAQRLTQRDRRLVERLVGPTGEHVWVDEEGLIDAVTAVSGSGPAYVFYMMESMVQAGEQMGLSPEQARRLVGATVTGAAALAAASAEPLDVLRMRVTSKGGTTHAAITAMADAGVQQSIVAAMWAANRRAVAMSQELGVTSQAPG